MKRARSTAIATPTEAISTPPSDEVAWTFHKIAGKGAGVAVLLPEQVTVRARTWFLARAAAMVALKAEPWELWR